MCASGAHFRPPESKVAYPVKEVGHTSQFHANSGGCMLCVTQHV